MRYEGGWAAVSRAGVSLYPFPRCPLSVHRCLSPCCPLRLMPPCYDGSPVPRRQMRTLRLQRRKGAGLSRSQGQS